MKDKTSRSQTSAEDFAYKTLKSCSFLFSPLNVAPRGNMQYVLHFMGVELVDPPPSDVTVDNQSVTSLTAAPWPLCDVMTWLPQVS